MASLHIIATPIGNRKDITLRALETMFSVDVLLCEDTRKTKQLMDFYTSVFSSSESNSWFNPQTHRIPRMISYFEHNEDRRIPEVFDLLNRGQEIGLVTNAGTPTISDPGYVLVKACLEQGFPVVSVPGVSALTSALSISGLAPDRVMFLGFLPRKAGRQIKLWQGIVNSGFGQTIVFYESPFRVDKTLQTLQTVFGDIEITIARELTKIHETVQQQLISQWLSEDSRNIKGEVVILFRSSQQEL